MKFRTENEFTHFKFSDVHVSDIMMSFGTFKICLDNVIIKADNSKNRDIRDMRTNGLILKLSDANIISFVREGFKTYDADGNLKSTTADEEIEETDYLDTFNNFLDGYAYLIEKENENYNFVFDGTDEFSVRSRISYLPDITAVHRRLPDSVSHSTAYRKRIAFCDSLMDISLWFDARYAAGRNRFRILRRRSSVALWVLSWEGPVGEYVTRWRRDSLL